MAKNILQDHGDAEGGNTTTTTKKPVKKEKKKTSKDGKGKKSKKEKSKKKSTSSSSDSSSSSDESGGSVEDPEQVMNSLALQLNMSQSMLKIKGSRILKIEDLSPEACSLSWHSQVRVQKHSLNCQPLLWWRQEVNSIRCGRLQWLDCRGKSSRPSVRPWRMRVCGPRLRQRKHVFESGRSDC